MLRVEHKRGDSFIANVTYRNADTQVAIDITSIDIKSQIRSASGLLIADLIVTKINSLLGRYELSIDDTQNWPFGQDLIWDIQYTTDGKKLSTKTMVIHVEVDATQ